MKKVAARLNLLLLFHSIWLRKFLPFQNNFFCRFKITPTRIRRIIDFAHHTIILNRVSPGPKFALVALDLESVHKGFFLEIQD